ncbi:transposase [Carboxylicivirga linearis]|uniref:Transposase n=1 Tax=Carboxylicivirga linearis TaxID=1628157 RepID=A0ABS5JQL8_9BACT|nr:transposase [Carboxylicivirga linearis]MBS2097115.1 transposase [Carboxylicivirga linearis]
MSQSLSKLFIHIVFHIKYDSPIILSENKKELFAYIGSIIKDNDSFPIIINGMEDHLHILCIMSKNIALAKLLEEIKRHSSRHVKTFGLHYRNFAWQGGYGAFSVSPSLLDKTKNYIQKQEEHHKKYSFKDEYLLFLNEYGIVYDDRYLWTD